MIYCIVKIAKSDLFLHSTRNKRWYSHPGFDILFGLVKIIEYFQTILYHFPLNSKQRFTTTVAVREEANSQTNSAPLVIVNCPRLLPFQKLQCIIIKYRHTN